MNQDLNYRSNGFTYIRQSNQLEDRFRYRWDILQLYRCLQSCFDVTVLRISAFLSLLVWGNFKRQILRGRPLWLNGPSITDLENIKCENGINHVFLSYLCWENDFWCHFIRGTSSVNSSCLQLFIQTQTQLLIIYMYTTHTLNFFEALLISQNLRNCVDSCSLQ